MYSLCAGHHANSHFIHHWMGCGSNPSEVYASSNDEWCVSRHGVPQRVSSKSISLSSKFNNSLTCMCWRPTYQSPPFLFTIHFKPCILTWLGYSNLFVLLSLFPSISPKLYVDDLIKNIISFLIDNNFNIYLIRRIEKDIYQYNYICD